MCERAEMHKVTNSVVYLGTVAQKVLGQKDTFAPVLPRVPGPISRCPCGFGAYDLWCLVSAPVLPGVSYHSMSDIVVEPYGVEKLLSKVKPSKASGPDEIPCRVLKETAYEIAPILTDIFNCSLSTGILPRDWKSANVAPVFKKGTPILQRITSQYR